MKVKFEDDSGTWEVEGKNLLEIFEATWPEQKGFTLEAYVDMIVNWLHTTMTITG